MEKGYNLTNKKAENTTVDIDAAEIVRCEDCEYGELCICVVCEDGKTLVCGRMQAHVPKRGFCHNGKRKTDLKEESE